jgi:RNA polymerase sigma-70 factor, ECF subfamily
MTETTQKERERFMQMVRGCEQMLLKHARHLARHNEDRAQDLVQDAIVRAYESFRTGKFLEGFKPCAWFSRILTNLFINDYRRDQKWGAGVTVDELTAGGEIGPEQTRTPSSDTPENMLLNQTFAEPIERALAQLPEALRLTILLVDVQEYSYQEAAEMLKIPIGTVRSRLARARFQLRELLDEYGEKRNLV